MKYITTIILIFSTTFVWTQAPSKVSVSFFPMYGNAPLVLNQPYPLAEKDSLQLEILKFYISNVELYDHEKKVYIEENSFHLIDAADEKSLTFELKIPEKVAFTHLRFNLGIDSLTNMEGVLGGDLDPSKGMYWTWQSGYINFKLEGTSKVCPTRKNIFQFHLGGYAFPNNSLQTIQLEKKDLSEYGQIVIKTDVEQFIHVIDLAAQNQIMSLGAEAVELSKKATKIFSIL